MSVGKAATSARIGRRSSHSTSLRIRCTNGRHFSVKAGAIGLMSAVAVFVSTSGAIQFLTASRTEAREWRLGLGSCATQCAALRAT